MLVSVIIPVYNEKKTIIKIVDLVRGMDINKEIIIIDDGSSDGTRDLLRKLEFDNVRVLFHKKNSGKGMAIRTALKHVNGEIIIIQDADLELDPNDYHKLLKPIIEKRTKIVYGARFINNPYPYFLSKVANLTITTTANLLYNSNICDAAAGYKVFTKDVIDNINLKCKRFEFCPEFTAKVLKKKYKIVDVPVSFYPRSVKEGKKIGWKDGFQALWTLLKYRVID